MVIYEWCIIINQLSELFDMVQKIEIENEKNLMNYSTKSIVWMQC